MKTLIWIAVLVIIAGLLLLWSGSIHFNTFFPLVGLAVLIAGFLSVVLLVHQLLTRVRGGEPTASTLTIVVGLTPFLVVAGLISQRDPTIPMIHNITTDSADPPVFVFAQSLRHINDNPIDPPGQETIAMQQQRYPELKNLVVPQSKEIVIVTVKELVATRGWEIIDVATEPHWQLEAVATTPLMRFRDDIAIRVTENTLGTEVAMRSVSRVGKSDLGANADRIAEFMDSLANRLNQ
ncbi:MAG: DUF1499 domain-containing protein [bacterium]